MRNLSDSQLQKLSIIQLFRHFSGADANDLPIGTTRLCDLPANYFEIFVRQHNSKIDRALSHLPTSRASIRAKVTALRITTYSEFQLLLDDTDRKKHIHPEFRKTRDHHLYKLWVLTQKPLSTLFREHIRKPFPAYIPHRARKKHTFLVSSSGGGKSELLKILLLTDKTAPAGKINRTHAAILIENQGDLSREIARQEIFWNDFHEHQTNPNIVYIDPLLRADEHLFPVFNPFDISGKNFTPFQIEKLAQQLTAAFVSMIGAQTELSLNMYTILQPCLMVLLHRPGSTLADLLRFFNRDPDLIALGKTAPNPAHRLFFEHQFLHPSFDRTRAALATKTQSLLNYEVINAVMCQPTSTLDLFTEIEAGKTIIFNLSRGTLGDDVSSTLGRFLVASILFLALNRAESQTPRIPISLLIDECQNFVSPALSTVLTQGRKFGLHVTLATQVVGQKMDPELTRIILGNCTVLGCGRAGTSSINAMAREMGAPVEAFTHLPVGCFLLKAGDGLPLRTQVTSDHLGTKTTMTLSEWQEVLTVITAKYYHRTSNTPINTQDQHDLETEIAAGALTTTAIPGEPPSLAVEHFDFKEKPEHEASTPPKDSSC